MLIMLCMPLAMMGGNTKKTVTQVTDSVALTDNVDYIISGDTPFTDDGKVNIVNTDHAVLIINKVKPSVYVIVSMLHIGDSEAMLFVNWANYLNRLRNEQVQMPKIEKNCPTLYAVMTGDDPDGVYECDCRPDGTMYHGFSLKVEVPSKVAILECISPEMFAKGRLLANKCLKMYSELIKNPPFPAWKDGLDELWN